MKQIQLRNKPNGGKDMSTDYGSVQLSPGRISHLRQVTFLRYQSTVPSTRKFRIATWNVRTLYQIGKLENVEREMNRLRVDIPGLSEVRWPEVGCSQMDNGGTFVYLGGDTAEKGVGIMLTESVAKCMIGYWAVSDRVLLVRIKGNPFNICFIQVYSPTTQNEENEMDKFYREVQSAKGQCTQHEMIIVMGHLNAKVGNERFDEVVGPWGLGDRNDRGERWIEWCMENKQIIVNTWFRHHPRHLWTWKSPGDRSRSQIDYITISKRFRNALTQVKTYLGTDWSSDHVSVIAIIKLKLKRIAMKNIISKRQLITLRKNEDIKTRYNVVVKNKYEAMKDEIGENIAEQQWELLQEAIRVGNEKVIPTSERKAKRPWMAERILIMMDERIKFKGLDDQRYKSINRMIHKECNKARETWMNDHCMDIENLSKRDQQMMYEKVSELTRERMYKQGKAIKKKDGTVVMGKEEVMERWDEYISERLKDKTEVNMNIQENV